MTGLTLVAFAAIVPAAAWVAGLRIRSRELGVAEAMEFGLSYDHVWALREVSWRGRPPFIAWPKPVRRRYD